MRLWFRRVARLIRIEWGGLCCSILRHDMAAHEMYCRRCFRTRAGLEEF